MNEKGKHEMLHFYRYVEAELNRITAVSELYFTDESLRIMKRIYRKLRLQIMKVELALIHRKKQMGRITPKQARSELAKVKKKWRKM
ncbi:MAG: hypothetical protein IJD32_07230 [Bacteroidaceae bacterium]|nr:hypothetical protein [Bacteroidaceae bacterium]